MLRADELWTDELTSLLVSELGNDSGLRDDEARAEELISLIVEWRELLADVSKSSGPVGETTLLDGSGTSLDGSSILLEESSALLGDVAVVMMPLLVVIEAEDPRSWL